MKQENGKNIRGNTVRLLCAVCLISLIVYGTVSCARFSVGTDTPGNLTVGSVENNTSDGFSNHYMLFRGERIYTVTVDEKPLVLEGEITTTDGQIDILVIHGENQTVYNGTLTQTTTVTVELDKPGTYTVHIVGHDHKGGYSFTYKER